MTDTKLSRLKRIPAVQQQRPPSATLEDGLRNVAIMEAAREGQMQIALEGRGSW